MPVLSLEDSEVHVWFADPRTISVPRHRKLLNREEARRCEQFQSVDQRLRYLAAHALVRSSLSRYADVDPRRWEFSTSENGRPEIAGPEAAHGLAFNLSRTRDLVGCAIARGAQVGVDVAAIDSGDEPMLVAERFFRPAEIADLRSLPLHLQRGRFFDFWTLKEAYVKALGRGLRIPLGGFSFHLGQSISLEIEGAPEESGTGWQFALWSPTPVHRAALAVRTASGQPMTTRTEWWNGEQPATSSGAPTLGS